LDAIAVVELRYCYKTGMLAIAGSGQGFILADSFVKMISKHGVLVVNMPEIQACGKDRIETDTGVGMWNGKIITGVSVAGIKVTDAKARFLQVFNEANKATARVTMEKIKKEL
jgi:alpha-acetolactate decarboxylase